MTNDTLCNLSPSRQKSFSCVSRMFAPLLKNTNCFKDCFKLIVHESNNLKSKKKIEMSVSLFLRYKLLKNYILFSFQKL